MAVHAGRTQTEPVDGAGHGRAGSGPRRRAARATGAVVVRLRPRNVGRGETGTTPSHGTGAATCLAEAARRHGLFLAGSVPSSARTDRYATGTGVLSQRLPRRLAPQGPSVPTDAREQMVFEPGHRSPRSTTRGSDESAWSSGSTATFPRWPGPWRSAAPAWCWRPRPVRWRTRRPGTSCTPRSASTNNQRGLQAKQAGCHATSTLLGASRIIARRARWWPVPARPSGPGKPAELVVHRIDLHLAHRHEGVGALLEDGRRPALYTELVDQVSVVT